MLNFAIRVAQEAGRLLRDRLGTKIDVAHKGAINLVTDVDYASERLIREMSQLYAGNLFFGEDLMEIPVGSPVPAKLD